MSADRLTLAEAAIIAGLGTSGLRRAALRGTLKATREGPEGPRGQWYVTRADLDRYLDNRPERFKRAVVVESE